jgi:vacuolar-type H+-ATPase subunit E/Vma4
MTNLIASQLRRSLRGYAPEEVDGVVEELIERVTAAEDKLYELERTLQQALRELADANQRIARNLGASANLGTDFASTLRLAEMQAERICREAEREARELVAEGRAQADLARDQAHWESQEVLADGRRRAEALLVKVKKRRHVAPAAPTPSGSSGGEKVAGEQTVRLAPVVIL